MKNQGNMTSPKDHNNLPVTKHKDMEIYDLPDKKFQIAILRKCSELQKTLKDNSVKSGK